jgi:hypothetical protein
MPRGDTEKWGGSRPGSGRRKKVFRVTLTDQEVDKLEAFRTRIGASFTTSAPAPALEHVVAGVLKQAISEMN